MGPRADGQELKPQIPWLRVFVEGVVMVGSILLAGSSVEDACPPTERIGC